MIYMSSDGQLGGFSKAISFIGGWDIMQNRALLMREREMEDDYTMIYNQSNYVT